MNNYRKPSITVDIIIFNENKEFVLIKRRNNPFKGYWAIPGGFIDYGESAESAAIREAKEETGICIKLDKLLNVYSESDRDPRGHTITIVYLASGNIQNMKAGSDAVDIRLYSFDELSSLKIAFDHEKIIKDALLKDA